MSGGPKGTGIKAPNFFGGDNRAGKSQAGMKDDWDPMEDPVKKAQRLAADKANREKGDAIARAAALVAPDTADLALKDSTSGKVRRVRAGSSRASIIGQAMEFVWLLGVVGVGWVQAVLRGDVW